MGIKDNYSEEEWFVIASAPSMIGSAVVTAGRSGAMGTMREILASARATAEVAKASADNELIQSILPSPEMARDEAKAEAQKMRDSAMEKVKAGNVESPDELADFALNTLRDALSLLGGVASEKDINEYKDWVRTVAKDVAEASKEGGFLGIGGERISEREAAFLARLEEIL